jgi:hypothetical protein
MVSGQPRTPPSAGKPPNKRARVNSTPVPPPSPFVVEQEVKRLEEAVFLAPENKDLIYQPGIGFVNREDKEGAVESTKRF